MTRVPELKSYGSSLFDESACRVLRFRVPPQVHSNHLSEVVFENAMRKLNLPREALVIMTKASKSTITAMPDYGTNTVFNPVAAESIINRKALNGEHIFDFVEASSTHLQPEYIDVLQCHRLKRR
ncbi:uncharacterized protein TRAVEDRAFT_51934 [Trametes versicolor FP-101664 SS1]|uniref:uncharacterized protein n=1 Tax=Trametes versicolor (strain FP-101664) TaxID=717944 RepID=UPI0004621E04|nr:uncharacterized protein TRAVEDRAFT_51934 [Trametes versicolor FP-101664 SS1]EIW54217.1 hypothetical protein TRAVEDRAFT_51934 [Trametes versicolor FP-101664 SS1]